MEKGLLMSMLILPLPTVAMQASSAGSPYPAVQAVASSERVDAHLERAVALGLMESGLDPVSRQPRYLVSNILVPLLADEITADERKAACHQGATALHALWVL